SAGSLGATGWQGNSFLRTAVHRVVQLDALQTEIVLSINLNPDFFDRGGLIVASWARYLDFRRAILLRLDKVILAQPDVLAAFHRGYVIHAVFVDRHHGDELPALSGL